MRRRALLLMITTAVALVVATGVALAADINCTGGPCAGTARADTMTGTAEADDMDGRGGADTMLARGGADTLLGGLGNDDISAGPGSDPSIKGGAGDDSLSGGDHHDTYVFSAGWGADLIPAGGEGAGMGTDTLDFSSLLVDPLVVDLRWSANRDEAYLAEDPDTLNFADGTVEIENVTGGGARDLISGNELPNRLVGNGGDDVLDGFDNEDVLSGRSGADALEGGTGDDQLNGGLDNDVYLFQDGWGQDRITGDALGTDRLFFGRLTSSVTVDLSTGTATAGTNSVSWSGDFIENVIGGTADDKLYGDGSGNTLHGQGGDDEIDGRGSDDEIYGRGDNDTLSGGPGVDRVYGDHPDFPNQTGDDTIDVADGDPGDIVDCGPDATASGDTVYVDAIQDPSTGTIEAVDSVTNCETVNKELVN